MCESVSTSGRVGKNPGFFKKNQPSGFFWVFLGFWGFWGFLGFFGVFWGFLGFFGFFWVFLVFLGGFLPRLEGF